MPYYTRLILLIIISGFPGVVLGSTSGDPLFADHEPLAVTIKAPLRALARDRAEEPEYRPGTFSFTDLDGSLKEVEIKVRPRGKSRRRSDVCRFPPLRLNFRKKQVQDTLLDEQNVLKLVTHCRSSEQFQQYVLKEYLAYRLFNLMSDVSFRVRLLKITYIDSERDAKPLERYGFLIEHKNRLAQRLGTTVVDLNSIGYSDLAPEQASLVELYQYMISNTDFSIIAAMEGESCCHNSILLQGPGETYLPVPYDFDRTGFVDPPNGEPAEELGQRSLRDRLYRGFCRDPLFTEAAIAKADALRPQFEALIAQQADLSGRSQKKITDFLAGYYRTAQDPKRREAKMKCRGPMTTTPLTGG
jgi:hypothetical protein